ncbi:MAG: hypothetical protein MSG64_11610 [Pyrinomonadaceae bacterium MAG19_C2-C3]|nr:hypothetical protein [Pyrinomonadaceae bacterium MAG19_C2-C3]
MNEESTLVRNLGCKFSRGLMCLLLLACVAYSVNRVAVAQQPEAARAVVDKVNYDVEVNILAATPSGNERLPARLDAVARQLNASLTNTNFRVAATFLHRVKEGGNLEVKGVAGALFQAAPNANTPTFYEFSLSRVNANEGVTNGMIDVQNARFGLRVPITVGGTSGQGGGFPVINYEPVGITTSLGFRENTPTIVGTITTPNSNELLVIVVTMRSTGR